MASGATVLRRLRDGLTTWPALLGSLVVVILVVAIATTPGFASRQNASASLALQSEKALMVLPLVLLVIMREIDISVASTAALAAVVAGMQLRDGRSLAVAVAAAIVVGALCGAFNGLCVTVLGLPSLVVTLGTLALYRGLCYVLLGGTPTSVVPDQLSQLANDNVSGTAIPWAIVPFLILAPAFAIVLHGRPAGRRMHAIGGNPQAARYSGVRSDQLRFSVFVVSGVVCSLAGLISIGRNSAASPDGLLGYELDALTVVFLGGVSVLGGRGRMSGVVWALALLISLRSVLQLHNVSGYSQGTAVGVLLMTSLMASNAAVAMSAALKGRRQRGDPRAPALAAADDFGAVM